MEEREREIGGKKQRRYAATRPVNQSLVTITAGISFILQSVSSAAFAISTITFNWYWGLPVG
jgi:hypothetical protein